jgi:hypothetical protein
MERNTTQRTLAEQERLAAGAPVLQALMNCLHAFARANPELPVGAAAMAAMDLGATLCTSTGLLWAVDGIPDALRDLAADLERRQAEPAAQPLKATLGEFFASGRPALAN